MREHGDCSTCGYTTLLSIEVHRPLTTTSTYILLVTGALLTASNSSRAVGGRTGKRPRASRHTSITGRRRDAGEQWGGIRHCPRPGSAYHDRKSPGCQQQVRLHDVCPRTSFAPMHFLPSLLLRQQRQRLCQASGVPCCRRTTACGAGTRTTVWFPNHGPHSDGCYDGRYRRRSNGQRYLSLHAVCSQQLVSRD